MLIQLISVTIAQSSNTAETIYIYNLRKTRWNKKKNKVTTDLQEALSTCAIYPDSNNNLLSRTYKEEYYSSNGYLASIIILLSGKVDRIAVE
jgi:hypothetical protein